MPRVSIAIFGYYDLGANGLVFASYLLSSSYDRSKISFEESIGAFTQKLSNQINAIFHASRFNANS